MTLTGATNIKTRHSTRPLDAQAGRRRPQLIWIDLEMTGLNPETDRIIEIALVVTDTNLGRRAEGPVLAMHQDDADAG